VFVDFCQGPFLGTEYSPSEIAEMVGGERISHSGFHARLCRLCSFSVTGQVFKILFDCGPQSAMQDVAAA